MKGTVSMSRRRRGGDVAGHCYAAVAGMPIAKVGTGHIRSPRWFIPRDPGPRQGVSTYVPFVIVAPACARLPTTDGGCGQHSLSVATGVTAQESATPTPIGLVQEAENLPECAPPRSERCPRESTPRRSTRSCRGVGRALSRPGGAGAGRRDRGCRRDAGHHRPVWLCGGWAAIALLSLRRRPAHLQSDQAKRDNYLYQNTLEAERYPWRPLCCGLSRAGGAAGGGSRNDPAADRRSHAA